MSLMERIYAAREPLSWLVEFCMYCGKTECQHANAWRSRAWSSDCAAMQPVSPSLGDFMYAGEREYAAALAADVDLYR